MQLFLTPSSIAFFCQFLFVSLLGVVCWSLYIRTAPTYKRSVLFFALLISGCAILLLIFFLDVSFLSKASSIARTLIFPLSAAILLILFLFLFSFPPNGQRRARVQQRLLATLVGFFLLAEVWFALSRILSIIGTGDIVGRPEWLGTVQIIVILALGVLFVMRLLTLEPKETGRSLWKRLISPHNVHAGAYRGFLVIWAIPILLLVANALYAAQFISLAGYYLALSIGVVAATLGFTFVFVSTLPLGFRFRETASISTLAVLLVSLSVLGWAISPYSSSHYSPSIPVPTTYHFTPVDGGTAYSVEEVEYNFDPDLGERLNLAASGDVDSYTLLDLAFPFTFFQKPNSSLYLSVNGVISFDKPFRLAQMLEGGQANAAIVPMYVDIYPGEPSGGIFTKLNEDALLVTWYRSRPRLINSGLYTFQVALQRNGGFEITYVDVPETLMYSADDDPQATPLFAGVLCTDLAFCGLSRSSVAEVATAYPLRVESSGFVMDFYQQYRFELNSEMWPIAWVVFVGSLLIIAMQFLMLRIYVDTPLNSLLDGIGRLEQGHLQVDLPVYFADEIGQLTRQFNAMAGVLRSAITGQEKRLAKTSTGVLGYPGLTPTQWEVLKLVAAGKVYKEIGLDLHITERTVKYHMGRILDILQVENRAQAIALAHDHLTRSA